MTPEILTDAEVVARADMARIIAAMEEVFRARAAGSFIAPPRHVVPFPGRGSLVFTIGGGLVDGRSLAGFRVYETFAAPCITR